MYGMYGENNYGSIKTKKGIMNTIIAVIIFSIFLLFIITILYSAACALF